MYSSSITPYSLQQAAKTSTWNAMSCVRSP